MSRDDIARRIVAHLALCGVVWPGGWENARVVRSRAGELQRKAGASSWTLRTVDDDHSAPVVIGFETATETARAKVAYLTVEYGDYVLNVGEPRTGGKWFRKPLGVSRVEVVK